MASRTFRLEDPPMQGTDVNAWRRTLNEQMDTWNVPYQLEEDGPYDQETRALTASVCYGLGLASATEAMKDGVTGLLRSKLRNKALSVTEQTRYVQRAEWRAAFALRHAKKVVATPIAVILNDSWGYHPPVHDGVDLICNPNAVLHAICDGEIVRADAGGWWGKGAPADAALKAKGDGIIVLRSSVRSGPFVPGLNFCYGHAEKATVRVGQRVRAGDVIGHAGLANAWHAHFMVNGRADVKGLGDRDPMPFVRWARGV